VSDDVYSNFLIMMRDLAPTDTPFLTCPYHDEGEMAVTMTFKGRAFAAGRERLTFDEVENVDPLTVISNGKYHLWENGFINVQSGPTVMYTGSYTDGDTMVINLKVEEDSTGFLNVKLPANSRLNLLCSAGLVIFESSETDSFNFDADFDDTSGYKVVVVGSTDHIQKFGRDITVSSQ